MNILKKGFLCSSAAIIFLLSVTAAFSQEAAPYHQKVTRQEHDSVVAEIKNDTIMPNLINKVHAYTLTIDRSNSYVRRKINLDHVSRELPDIEISLKKFRERLAMTNTPWNLRGLNSVVILLKETSKKLTGYQANLNNYSRQLAQNNKDVKAIINDPILDHQLPDSTLESQLQDVRDEVFELDTLQQRALTKVNWMRNRTSIALLQANDILSDLAYETSTLKMAMWGNEDVYLFAASTTDYNKTLGTVMIEGLQRSYTIIGIYLSAQGGPAAFCLLFFVFTLAWNILNMRKIKKLENAASILDQVIFLRRSIFIASLFGLFVYSPFVFANPTMSYLHATELLRLTTLGFLLAPFLSKQSKLYGVLLLLLWVYYALDDILLEPAFGERWCIFFAGLILAGICIKLISFKGPYFKGIAESSASKALLIFTLAQVVLSIAFNLSGRSSLAKIFGVSAIQCLLLGISLKIFCTIVLESIYMQSEAFQDSRFSEFINFKELQHRFKRVLWILAVALWVVSLIRNLTLYDSFIAFMTEFIYQQRNIGSVTFTFESVAIFFLIIWISTVVSNFVNFFFGHNTAKKSGKRSSLGSLLLIIRLGIWALGFLIAVAASGIPVDRLSIMIGALSVGIGFGLQNIVNNLVSGIIIAFEQPIKVGDQIEVGDNAGTVKAIGVRSSTIKSGDGANIIVPNGNLLSQNLINWTMQNRNKRVEFIIGISYIAKISKAKEIIQETLDKSEHILHVPVPVIMVQTFAEKSIEIRIIFWVTDLATAGTMRSSAMIEIFEALQQGGIELPGLP